MVDQARIEAAVRELLKAIGEDPDRDGLKQTPSRVARMYEELFSGMQEDPSVHLKAVFNEHHHEVVLVRDIPFHSMCEHHLMPFTGRAHIAYIPDGKIIGISKLGRILDAFARRPQVQERLTSQVADFLSNGLNAKAVAVVVEAVHTCMTVRGVRKPGSAVVTSALRGLCLKNPATREEIMSLIHAPRRAD
ncbi:MAG: GTP cyclohydrolase I FolE [Planctomycetes bacterium]|nr:GTP cyclohydrolase I FolE [Planctomycetota bacterium]